MTHCSVRLHRLSGSGALLWLPAAVLASLRLVAVHAAGMRSKLRPLLVGDHPRLPDVDRIAT